MIKTVGIVSLSSGVLGEGFVAHEVELGVRRLEEMGLEVRFMPHARDGLASLAAHPEHRAQDLLRALSDPGIDLVLCAIGGDDTYRLLPHLFEGGELEAAVRTSCGKPFLGFSDTTVNHLMLHRLGARTFYGQAFLPDVCELGQDMLAYTRGYFEELVRTGAIRCIEPAGDWYEERTSWGPDQVGTTMPSHPNQGFELLQGEPAFSGEVLGGCVETLFSMIDGTRYADEPALVERYGTFPDAEDWAGKVVLLETCEERPAPDLYRRMIVALKRRGVFSRAAGVLMGKPQDEKHFSEYKRIIVEVVDDLSLPIVANVNVGHATPRCIVPLGVPCTVDVPRQRIDFHW